MNLRKNLKVGNSWRLVFIAVTAKLLSAVAYSQGFNCDLNSPFAPPEGGGGAPSSNFGAAANQPGFWNDIFTGGLPGELLTSLDGQLSSVLITGPMGGGGLGFNMPGLEGDYRLLMADARGIGNPATYTLTSLINGRYKVYTYATRPNGGTTNALVTVLESLTPNPQVVTGPMPMNTFSEGITHSIHIANVTAGTLTIHIDDALPQVYLNGFQIVQLSSYSFPTSYTVIQGLNFGGSLASILTSDDQRASILSDEFSSNGEFEFTSTLPAGSVSQLKFKFEGKASRSDLSQFLKMRNYSTGIYTNVDIQTATLLDSIAEGTISSGVSNYFSASREVKTKVLWIPQNDITAMDGWVEGCDQAMWEMVF